MCVIVQIKYDSSLLNILQQQLVMYNTINSHFSLSCNTIIYGKRQSHTFSHTPALNLSLSFTFLSILVLYGVFPHGYRLVKGDAVGEFFSKPWDRGQVVVLKEGIKCVHQPVIKALL